jgi:hypothetical protein
MDDSMSNSFIARNREISNAINNRNPSTLLNLSFTKGSIILSHPIEEPSDSSVHLRLLKGSIDSQRLATGKGDKTVSVLRQELKQLELEDIRHEFWLKKSTQKVKDLQESIEDTIRRQSEEITNQEIYNHLLKRMKKTKIFLEIRSGLLNENLKTNDSVLNDEKKKHLVSKEAAMQAKTACKQFERAIKREKFEGENQIGRLQVSISKNVEAADRQEVWKKHRETMFEAAVIEDRSAKSLTIKESVSLHRLWYSVLTKIFERKKEKSQKLEEAFQRIKIATGIPEINLIVENFLTKEQTYDALMKTVSSKEVECSEYKMRIDDLQTGVNNYSNRTASNNSELDQMRTLQEGKIRELIELSNKKFFIENIHSKVRTWMKLMIRKFFKIVGSDGIEVKDEKDLKFYLKIIARIFKNAKKVNQEMLGKAVEDRRKLAVASMIKNLAKVPHSFLEEEVLNENSLIGDEADEKMMNRPF